MGVGFPGIEVTDSCELGTELLASARVTSSLSSPASGSQLPPTVYMREQAEFSACPDVTFFTVDPSSLDGREYSIVQRDAG